MRTQGEALVKGFLYFLCPVKHEYVHESDRGSNGGARETIWEEGVGEKLGLRRNDGVVSKGMFRLRSASNDARLFAYKQTSPAVLVWAPAQFAYLSLVVVS